MDRHQAISDFLAKRHYAAINPVAALIDMDGTLYDSMGHHADAWMKMVSGLGINMPRDEFFRYEGRTGASTINIIFNKAYGRDATQENVYITLKQNISTACRLSHQCLAQRSFLT